MNDVIFQKRRPFGTTQDGIAATLGISRAHASLELKKLAEKGRVGKMIAHVPEHKRRRTRYFLNPCGLSAVLAISERMKGKEHWECKG